MAPTWVADSPVKADSSCARCGVCILSGDLRFKWAPTGEFFHLTCAQIAGVDHKAKYERVSRDSLKKAASLTAAQKLLLDQVLPSDAPRKAWAYQEGSSQGYVQGISRGVGIKRPKATTKAKAKAKSNFKVKAKGKATMRTAASAKVAAKAKK